MLIQWLAVLGLVLTVRHNSWLYYQGGDQTYYYTTGSMFSHWRMPTAEVGWGWPYVLTPIAGIAGNVVLSGLPGVLLLNGLILLPIGLIGMYGIGSRLGGRVFGYWSAALWLAVPFVAIPLFVQRYHGKYVEQTLPQTFGMTPLADFPSMVLLIVAAYLVLRALDTRAWQEAVLAGLVVGFAFAVKPSNVIFFAAPIAAFVLARRWRQLVGFGATVLPGLLLVVLWKQRGLGSQPLFASGGDGTLAALGLPLAFGALAGDRPLRAPELAAPAGQQGRAAGVLLGDPAAAVARDRRRARAAPARLGEGGARLGLVLRLPRRQGHLGPGSDRGRELLPAADAEPSRRSSCCSRRCRCSCRSSARGCRALSGPRRRTRSG